jgi:hypothetical protein
MKNLHDLKTFQSMKKTSALSGNEKTNKNVNKINENSVKIGDNWEVTDTFSIPVSLVNAYAAKIKNETGQNLRDTSADAVTAERLVRYLIDNYLNIENLPTSIFLGDDSKGAQVEPQMQTQPQMQPQMQTQPPEEIQSQEIQTPQGQAEATAQEIPAQEGGGQGQEIQSQATQSQIPQV